MSTGTVIRAVAVRGGLCLCRTAGGRRTRAEFGEAWGDARGPQNVVTSPRRSYPCLQKKYLGADDCCRSILLVSVLFQQRPAFEICGIGQCICQMSDPLECSGGVGFWQRSTADTDAREQR